MEKNSILYILESNGIDGEHLALFKEKLKDKKFTLDDCDKLLVKLGYEKLFLLDEDYGEDDDEYDDFEPIRHKRALED
jgi:hypothetical protein